jgi:exosortase A-associated hydrolase 1
MTVDEQVVGFDCDGERLWGVLSRPAQSSSHRTAVLIVVGGPQYRVGSHRQFVQLARHLAQAGFPTLRFDYRGMGDSDGERRDFTRAGPDIRAALDALSRRCPTVDRFVIWGLCDAASAALMYVSTDSRVTGVVAANPWVRSEASLAATHIRHYYLGRLASSDFWAKLSRGRVDWRASFGALFGSVRAVFGAGGKERRAVPEGSFQDAMARGLTALRGQLLLILSGNDLTAKEFTTFTASSPSWRRLLERPNVARHEIAESDHTFSRRQWLDEVQAQTVAWLHAHGGYDVRPTGANR